MEVHHVSEPGCSSPHIRGSEGSNRSRSGWHGASVSDTVRMLLTKVARERTLVSELFDPNDTTLAAMKETQSGNLPRVRSVTELLEAMDAED